MKRYVRHQQKPLSVRRSERKTRNRFIFTIFLGIFLVVAIFWILPLFIGGLSVLNSFKATPKISEPISESTTLAPPTLDIPFEATTSSSINVGGYAMPNSSVEIYLDDELKTTSKTKDDGSFLAENIELKMGLNNILGKTIDEQQTRSLPSKTTKIIYDNEKPSLEVNEPQDGKILNDKKVTVSGTTDPTETAVTINGVRAIINNEGKFSTSLEINEGESEILIKAEDLAGNMTQVTRKITYTPSPTPTPAP